MSNYISGKSLNLLPFEIFNLVKEGILHPFDQYGRPIPPPHVCRLLDRKQKAEQELQMLPLKEGTMNAGHVMTGSKSGSFNREDELRKIEDKKKTLPIEIDKINKKLAAIPDIYSWSSFELPKEERNANAVCQCVANALYHKDDIDRANQYYGRNIQKIRIQLSPLLPSEPQQGTRLEKLSDPATPKETAPVKEQQQQTDEDKIKEISIAYVSDSEICIRYGKEDFIVARKDIGVGEKPWRMCLEMIKDQHLEYYVGVHDKDGDPVKIKGYNSQVKLFENFSKPFVQFLNQKFSLSFHENFKVFMNMKHFERPGTYKPKFHVHKYRNPEQENELKELSKEEVIEIINDLLLNHMHESDETKKQNILDEIIKLRNFATSNNLMTLREFQNIRAKFSDSQSEENDIMPDATEQLD